LFGLAVLAKPSISPLTITAFVLCIALASSVDMIEHRPAGWKGALVKANTAAIFVVLLFAAAYSPSGWHQIIDYIKWATAGNDTGSYFLKGGFRTQALYYISGIGGKALIGAWAFVSLLLMLTGLFLFWRRHVDSGSRLRVASAAIVALFLYASVSLTGLKSIYLGAVVPWLFFFLFLQGLNSIYAASGPRAFAILAIALAVFGVEKYEPHWERKAGQRVVVSREEAAWRTKLLQDIATDLVTRGVGKQQVFLTSTEPYLNSTTLNLATFALHAPDLTPTDLNYSDKMSDVDDAFSKTNFVLAFSPDNPDVLKWLPSYKLLEPTWIELQHSNQFKLLRTFPNQTGGSIVLYGKVAQ